MSFTLFLNNPTKYQGGELVIVDGMDGRVIKLPAGQLMLYPSYSVHRVEPVTYGAQLACFPWLESMVREPQQRGEHGETDTAARGLACALRLMCNGFAARSLLQFFPTPARICALHTRPDKTGSRATRSSFRRQQM